MKWRKDMINVRNILLGATLFAFVGCGTDGTPELGGQQGAMGQYNNTFGNQDVAGIWTVQSKQEYFTLDLDANGNVYNVPTDSSQKQKIASYSLSSNQELKITTNDGGQTVATYVQADQNSNNCFYVDDQFSKQGNPFTGQKVRELWCKQVVSNNQGTATGGGAGTGFANDKRPTLQNPTGMSVELKEYMYPYQTLTEGKRMVESVYNYTQDTQGTLTYESYIEKEFSRSVNNGIVTITEKQNSQEHKTDEIYANKIISFTKNNYGYDREEYPTIVQTNTQVVSVGDESVQMSCVVSSINAKEDLSAYVPTAILNDMMQRQINNGNSTVDVSQFTYSSVLTIHCGATNGIEMDSYHVANRGEVLNIVKYPDGGTRYEILDQKTYHEK
jgi:hypothetical protein